jgi:lysozyme family protein
MKADFGPAFKKVIGLESGYVNDPNDPGGETMWGISKRQYPNVDIKNLELEHARAIYKRDYWNSLQLDKVESQLVAEEVFEQSVNLGKHVAAKHLQTALNYLGQKLEVDGIIGKKTLEAVNWYPHEESLLKTLNGVQFMYYLNIVKANPAMRKYARGWLRRIEV